MTQSKVHDTHDQDTYTDSYAARQQQIRLDAMLSRQIQAKEHKCLAEHIKQIENKRSLEYEHNQRRDQIIPDPPLSNIHNDDQRPEKYMSEERFKNPKFTGFFQGQANLNTGRVAGYFYNTCTRLTFKKSPIIKI